jgi:hypothetical protein
MKGKLEKKTNILISIFVTSLVLANILGSKVTTIFGITTSVGIFAYPLTFLVTDIIEEVRGKKAAKTIIHAGIVALILSFILILIGINIPPSPIYQNNSAYTIVFSNSLRVILASFIAFIIAQNHDIWSFNFWKKKTHGKFLWLRNNLSTIVSQFIDTTIFTFIAFYQVSPGFTVSKIFAMIIPYFLLKILFALVDTPFAYLGVKWFKS